MCLFFAFSNHFDWATSDIIGHQRNPGGKMEHGMLMKTTLWGKMERSKIAPFHFTLKGFWFCPNALVLFTHALSTYENFSDESVLMVLGRGSLLIVAKWRILAYELSHHWFR